MVGRVTKILGSRHYQHPHEVEYDIGCDPGAAAIVFGTGVRITLITLDVTERVRFDKTHLEALRKSSNPLASLLCE